VHDHDPSPDKALVEDLTWREQELLALLAERLSNREIGDRLHLAETTVKSHVGSIISKLGVKNRRQVIERATELGLLDSDRISAPKPTHALPAEPTPFIGRAEELAEIHHLLAETRLLTLTGTGGIGKRVWPCRLQATCTMNSRKGSSLCRWPQSVPASRLFRPSLKR